MATGRSKMMPMMIMMCCCVCFCCICVSVSGVGGYYYMQSKSAADAEAHKNDEPAFSPGDDGNGYRGKQNKTISNLTCQKWKDSDSPGIKALYNKYKSDYKLDDGDGNSCRNFPDTKMSTIWCPTTKGIELCAPIGQPTCSSDIEALSGKDGSMYRGLQNKTHTGKTCDLWNATDKGEEKINKYPGTSLINNYCRNPDGTDGIWCYVKDGDDWEHCNPIKCTS